MARASNTTSISFRIASRVLAMRVHKNMSIHELAEKSHLSTSTIRRIEAASNNIVSDMNCNPKLSTLIKISFGLGVPFSGFMNPSRRVGLVVK